MIKVFYVTIVLRFLSSHMMGKKIANDDTEFHFILLLKSLEIGVLYEQIYSLFVGWKRLTYFMSQWLAFLFSHVMQKECRLLFLLP